MNIRLLFLLSALALPPFAARGQADLPTGQLDLSASLLLRPDGAGAGLSALYRTGPRWRLGLQVSYYSFPFRLNDLQQSTYETQLHHLFILPTISYDLFRSERWRLHAGIGLGGRLSKGRGSPGWSFNAVPALHIGLEYNISSRFFATAQLSGFHQTRLLENNYERIIGTGSFIQGSIGVGYRLGR